MIDQFKAFWKKLLSYTKTKWDLDDYPLRYKKQANPEELYNAGELKLWRVQIINWWTMTGLGDTKQQAYENLKSNFKSYLEHNEPSRPGSTVPLSFADTSEIEALQDLAADVFERILNLNYYECFVSDESSFFDFETDDEETLRKINAAYGLGLTDLGDGNIVRLLTLIKAKAK